MGRGEGQVRQGGPPPNRTQGGFSGDGSAEEAGSTPIGHSFIIQTLIGTPYVLRVKGAPGRWPVLPQAWDLIGQFKSEQATRGNPSKAEALRGPWGDVGAAEDQPGQGKSKRQNSRSLPVVQKSPCS